MQKYDGWDVKPSTQLRFASYPSFLLHEYGKRWTADILFAIAETVKNHQICPMRVGGVAILDHDINDIHGLSQRCWLCSKFAQVMELDLMTGFNFWIYFKKLRARLLFPMPLFFSNSVTTVAWWIKYAGHWYKTGRGLVIVEDENAQKG